MSQSSSSALALMPDIAQQTLPDPQGELAWVGMNRIHQPVRLTQAGQEHLIQALVDVYVDLTDPHAKGIHMSRLYLQLDQHARQHALSPVGLKVLLNAMLKTHHEISGSARIRFQFDFTMQRSALKSDNAGWSSYPVTVDAVLEDGAFTFELGVTVVYSSTCPCSAALARQLVQSAFDHAFDPNVPLRFDDVRAWLGTPHGIVATPHSQRSLAQVRVRLDDRSTAFPVSELIDTLEKGLATPVQTAVKREDEQEFALRNGQNPMFCEDAARKLKRLLDGGRDYLDYWIRVEHQESLHAHDAVAIAVKGVDGGFTRL
jgi:GTP cyclohydrolase I